MGEARSALSAFMGGGDLPSEDEDDDDFEAFEDKSPVIGIIARRRSSLPDEPSGAGRVEMLVKRKDGTQSWEYIEDLTCDHLIELFEEQHGLFSEPEIDSEAEEMEDVPVPVPPTQKDTFLGPILRWQCIIFK